MAGHRPPDRAHRASQGADIEKFVLSFRDTYTLFYRLTGRTETARQLNARLWGSSQGDQTVMGQNALRLLRQAAAIASEAVSGPVHTFDEIDSLIRPDSEPAQATMAPEEQEKLQWDLAQACLTWTLGALGISERLALALVTALGLTSEQAAWVLELSPSAFRVRLSRATTKLELFLGPRCGLLHPENLCHCSERLPFVLPQDILEPGITDTETIPEVGLPSGDVLALYRKLPRPPLR